MTTPNRRTFLQASALTLTAASYNRAADSPNEKVRVAIMGTRVRGKFLANAYLKQPNVEITHIIEPDENLLPKIQDTLKKQPSPPKFVKDVRKVLDDPTVTALVVAAPDHWHALATIWACQAGKHVYCEKPASHNIIEGRQMVKAARHYKRVVQIGTQRRSAEHVIAAREYIASGKLGKVPMARAWIAGSRPSIGHKANAPVPQGVDYNLWLGPASGEFNPNRFHYEWHWFWDLGTGEIGNNGIHGLDMVRNVLNLDTPTRITSGGGRFFYDDDRQTPDTQICTFDFPTCSVVWEHKIWSKPGLHNEGFGVALYGEKGTMLLTSKGWEIQDGEKAEFKLVPDVEGTHIKNFLSCIKDGKLPNADVEIGHKSTSLCHLGNIAYRLNKTLKYDGATETFPGDAEANALLGRQYRAGFTLPVIG